MTHHSVVKQGVRVKQGEMSMKEAADCDVLDREVIQWRKEREDEITETKRNKKV